MTAEAGGPIGSKARGSKMDAVAARLYHPRQLRGLGRPSMFMKLAGRAVVASVLLVCVGCESSNGGGTGCDPCNTCSPCASASSAPPTEAAAATRDRLMGKASLTGQEKLMLADAQVELGQ